MNDETNDKKPTPDLHRKPWAAERLDVSEQQIDKLRRAGKLGYSKVDGSSIVYFTDEDIKAYIDKYVHKVAVEG